MADGSRSDMRERIQQVAMELFTRQGYDKTSLREIADRLDVTKAALYYHFRTKEDILDSVVADLAKAVDEVVEWGRAQASVLQARQEVLRRLSELVSSGTMRHLMTFSQENQAVLRDFPVGRRLQESMEQMFALVIDFEQGFAEQVKAQLAVLAILLSNDDALARADGGMTQVTPEQRAKITLEVALELISE